MVRHALVYLDFQRKPKYASNCGEGVNYLTFQYALFLLTFQQYMLYTPSCFYCSGDGFAPFGSEDRFALIYS